MTETTKGYDDSPPRNGVIAFYTVLALAVLLGTDFLLDSYFAKMMDDEVQVKVLTRGLEGAAQARVDEAVALEKSGLNNAIRSLSQQGRSGSPLIAPESGEGKAAVQGWSQLKREVAGAEAAPAPAPEATPPAEAAEGEAPPAADAAESTRAVNVSPQPANPNAADVMPQGGDSAPAQGKSPIAPGNRAAPAAGAPR